MRPREAVRTEAAPAPMLPHQPLLGLIGECEVVDKEQAAAMVIDRAMTGEGGFVCLCNTHLLTMAIRDPAVASALNTSWKRFPDGAPVVWLQRRLGRVGAERVAGPDLMSRVFDVGRQSGLRHFLLGSTPSGLESLRDALVAWYPRTDVVGSLAPPFGPNDGIDLRVVSAVREAEPHIVWCALGAPKQELWMQRHEHLLSDVLIVGVGAAFDFLSGEKRRAPLWMQEHGFEWLHRLISEPRRLGGRYVRTNTEFLIRSGLELRRCRA